MDTIPYKKLLPAKPTVTPISSFFTHKKSTLLHNNLTKSPRQQKNIKLQTSACCRGNSGIVAAATDEGTPLPDEVSANSSSFMNEHEYDISASSLNSLEVA